ncbi:MAG: hypothetical protein KGM98_11850 [Bacteroidota bacterium]|nr:hypothetical protein [Bacteroidota bacterium]
MSDFSLNKDMNIEIRVMLIAKGSDEPVCGEKYKVRLFDKAVFNDDYLGESGLDEHGVAKFVLGDKHFESFAHPDSKPDFYFLVYRDGSEIFKSRVMKNFDLSNIEEFKMKEGEVVDLGTFLIEP